jgi:hypothetical protein
LILGEIVIFTSLSIAILENMPVFKGVMQCEVVRDSRKKLSDFISRGLRWAIAISSIFFLLLAIYHVIFSRRPTSIKIVESTGANSYEYEELNRLRSIPSSIVVEPESNLELSVIADEKVGLPERVNLECGWYWIEELFYVGEVKGLKSVHADGCKISLVASETPGTVADVILVSKANNKSAITITPVTIRVSD